MSAARLAFFLLCLTATAHPTKVRFPGFDLLYKSSYAKLVNEKILFNSPLPPELRSITAVYNGLGVFEFGSRRVQHAFDALAKLLSVRFGSGNEAWLSLKQLETNQYRESLATDDIAPYLMFESVTPPYSALAKLRALLSGLDNTNVNVVALGSGANRSYLATSDFWRTWSFDPSSLSTLGKVEPHVPGAILPLLSSISTAHPIPEAGTDHLLTFATSALPAESLFNGGRLRVIRMRSAQDRELVADWALKHTPYMHSFSATEKYTVVAAAPLILNVEAMVTTVEPFLSLDWRPHESGTMYVVNHKRPTERYALPYKDGTYLMHHVNAYEAEENSIVFHATAYRDTAFLRGLELENLLNKSRVNHIPINSHVRRYQIFLDNGTVVSTVPEPRMPALHHMEMPVINEKHRYRKYCYVYGIVLKADGENLANVTLGKRNLCNNAEDRMWGQDGHYPSEPKFVPRRDAKAEDDGYLMSVVLDGWAKKSYLGIWDARTMEIIDRAYFPIPVPYRLHGHLFE